jgi:hypothetical protein
MQSVAIKPIMLGVVILDVVMLSVVASTREHHHTFFTVLNLKLERIGLPRFLISEA